MAIFFWCLFWAVCTGLLAQGRGGSGGGWGIVGAVLGPLGLLLAFTVGKSCPACRSKIHAAATRCPKCQEEISPSLPVAAAAPQKSRGTFGYACPKCGGDVGKTMWRCPHCKALFG